MRYGARTHPRYPFGGCYSQDGFPKRFCSSHWRTSTDRQQLAQSSMSPAGRARPESRSRDGHLSSFAPPRSLPHRARPYASHVHPPFGRSGAGTMTGSLFFFSAASNPAGTCAPRSIFRSHRGFVVQGRGAHAASSTPFTFGGWPLLPAGNADRAVAYPPRRSSTAARSAPHSSLANPLACQPGGERRRRATPRPSPAFPSSCTGGNRRMRRSSPASGAAR